MNTLLLLILLHSPGYGGVLITLLVAGLLIWLVFYVLPLPPMVRTILAVIVAVVLILTLLPGCGAPVTLSGAYQDDRGSRYEAGATFVLPAKKGYSK